MARSGGRLRPAFGGEEVMQINHRIASNSDDPFWIEIDRLGITYERGTLHVLNITEDNSKWPEVERLYAEHRPGTHFINNIFSQPEIDAAEWLQVSVKGHHGYPQPEDCYKEWTYDLTDYCRICGIGGVQNAPFRLRSEPKARHSQFIQLNWVFDEIFARTEAREGLVGAGITGILFVIPVLHKCNQASEQVAQMKIPTLLPTKLEPSGLASVTCKANNEERSGRPFTGSELGGHPYCGRVKYRVMRRGPFRFERFAFEGAPDVVKSREWFGSGAEARHLIVVSQKFRQLVSAMGWRGLMFEPIELVS
jgi:hypothetical protein